MIVRQSNSASTSGETLSQMNSSDDTGDHMWMNCTFYMSRQPSNIVITLCIYQHVWVKIKITYYDYSITTNLTFGEAFTNTKRYNHCNETETNIFLDNFRLWATFYEDITYFPLKSNFSFSILMLICVKQYDKVINSIIAMDCEFRRKNHPWNGPEPQIPVSKVHVLPWRVLLKGQTGRYVAVLARAELNGDHDSP